MGCSKRTFAADLSGNENAKNKRRLFRYEGRSDLYQHHPELIELVEQEVKSSWAMMWSCTVCRTPAFWQMFARQAM